MNATRWSQVERLYHAALEHPAGERVAFLRDACGDGVNFESKWNRCSAMPARRTVF